MCKCSVDPHNLVHERCSKSTERSVTEKLLYLLSRLFIVVIQDEQLVNVE